MINGNKTKEDDKRNKEPTGKNSSKVLELLIFKTHTLCPPTLGKGAEVCLRGQPEIGSAQVCPH